MPAIPLLEMQSGNIFLPLSVAGELHMLVKVRVDASARTTGHWPVPAARSYDGHPWERLHTTNAGQPVNVSDCGAGGCVLGLPAVHSYYYRVDKFYPGAEDAERGLTPLDLRKRTAARLLLHGTFGPTRIELTNLTAALAAGGSCLLPPAGQRARLPRLNGEGPQGV
jgi:hypothetical protein